MNVKEFERKHTKTGPMWATISTTPSVKLTREVFPMGSRIMCVGTIPEAVQQLPKSSHTYHGIVRGVEDALNTFVGMINSKPLPNDGKRCNIILVTVDAEIAPWRYWNHISDGRYDLVTKNCGPLVAADTNKIMQFLSYLTGEARKIDKEQQKNTYFGLNIRGQVMFFPALWCIWGGEKAPIYRKLHSVIEPVTTKD